uniref:Bgal_small_N domain-containing protein n=1 Tax=Steinernema glaseri TaxID=37863 RepID=A0A1I7ZVM9_9BILA
MVTVPRLASVPIYRSSAPLLPGLRRLLPYPASEFGGLRALSDRDPWTSDLEISPAAGMVFARLEWEQDGILDRFGTGKLWNYHAFYTTTWNGPS